MKLPAEQHNIEIRSNMSAWNDKPLLRRVYGDFYREMMLWLRKDVAGSIVELGAGIGNFKIACPESVATDIFPNPWIDRVESAYAMSFAAGSVSNLILFDVFHHLEFPGTALEEFRRVLAPGGRVIIFEPYISVFGFFIYGLLHHEPVAFWKKISWNAPPGADLAKSYYAAQGNSTRIFKPSSAFRKEKLSDWSVIARKRFSAPSYVLSGGFSKPALYRLSWLPFLKIVGKALDLVPFLFATRVLIVLEKKI